MSTDKIDALWRNFPRTAVEFEKRFATVEDCRAYWIEARWGGRPRCACCNSISVSEERGGRLFECADCGHQTSLTSGTLLEKTKKPFKVWFRAISEISSRRTGISAKDLQAYLDEFSFRYNRRKTKGVGRIAARTIEGLVSKAARTLTDITEKSAPYRHFRS